MPKCHRCNAEIEFLKCLVSEYGMYRMRADVHSDGPDYEKEEGFEFIAEKYSCPECGNLLFEDEHEALEFLRSRRVESGPYVFTKVDSVEQLKEILSDGNVRDFRLELVGCYSRKRIRLQKNGRFGVKNCIDESHQSLSEEELMDHGLTNIGSEMERGHFWLEEVKDASLSEVR